MAPVELISKLSAAQQSIASHRTRYRKEKDYVNTICAACEEPLAYTLPREKVTQLSCGHITHEVCLREYVKGLESANQTCPTCDMELETDLHQERGTENRERRELKGNHSEIEEVNGKHVLPRNEFSSAQSGLINGVTVNAPRDSSRSSESTHDTHPDLKTTTGRRTVQSRPRTVSRISRHQSEMSRKMEAADAKPALRERSKLYIPRLKLQAESPTLIQSQQSQNFSCLATIEVPQTSTMSTLSPADPSTTNRSENLSRGLRLLSTSPSQMQHSEAQLGTNSDLKSQVENWFGLEPARLGAIKLSDTVRVSKDNSIWKVLEVHLYTDFLVLLKPKRNTSHAAQPNIQSLAPRYKLKGSILIRQDLMRVEAQLQVLTLSLYLAVQNFTVCHLKFDNLARYEMWYGALQKVFVASPEKPVAENQVSSAVEVDTRDEGESGLVKSPRSSSDSLRSVSTQATGRGPRPATRSEVPAPALSLLAIDFVLIIPVAEPSRDDHIHKLLASLMSRLRPEDRLGLVTFGPNHGTAELMPLTPAKSISKRHVARAVRSMQESHIRADAIDAANVGMDMFMNRNYQNPMSAMILVSDCVKDQRSNIPFVVSRAEAAKVQIFALGLGLKHDPDGILELATRTKGSYLYATNWVSLQENLDSIVDALQSTACRSVKIELGVPESSSARIARITGAMGVVKRSTGRYAEVALHDLRPGEKREVLIQLTVPPSQQRAEQTTHDQWDSLVSGLEAISDPTEHSKSRDQTIEEVPLLHAQLRYSVFVEGNLIEQQSLKSALSVKMSSVHPLEGLEALSSRENASNLHAVSNPAIVQRRMELLASDMLTRAIALTTRGEHERAHLLLTETRNVLRRVNKNGVTNGQSESKQTYKKDTLHGPEYQPPRFSIASSLSSTSEFISAYQDNGLHLAVVDEALSSALEWIKHPAIFDGEPRRRVLQVIGELSTQRMYLQKRSTEKEKHEQEEEEEPVQGNLGQTEGYDASESASDAP